MTMYGVDLEDFVSELRFRIIKLETSNSLLIKELERFEKRIECLENYVENKGGYNERRDY